MDRWQNTLNNSTEYIWRKHNTAVQYKKQSDVKQAWGNITIWIYYDV